MSGFSINDIINKSEISQDEMCFLVEEYIFEKKGYRPSINIMRTIDDRIPEQMKGILIERQLRMLNLAYETAYTYYTLKQNQI